MEGKGVDGCDRKLMRKMGPVFLAQSPFGNSAEK